MSYEDVLTLLKYVPKFKKIDVSVEVQLSLVEKHMMQVRGSQSKGVVIEEIVDENVVNEPVKKGIVVVRVEWFN